MRISTFCLIEPKDGKEPSKNNMSKIIFDTDHVTVCMDEDDGFSMISLMDGFQGVVAVNFEEMTSLMEPERTYFHERIE